MLLLTNNKIQQLKTLLNNVLSSVYVATFQRSPLKGSQPRTPGPEPLALDSQYTG